MTFRKSFAAATALLASAAILTTSVHVPARAQGPVEVLSAKILNFRLGGTETRFGRLEFVGGLQLSSDAKEFGGFSAVRVRGGKVWLVSDRCRVFTATMARDVTGAPHDLTDFAFQLLPRKGGKALSRFGYYDCEALDLAGDTAFIAFEHGGSIGRFAVESDGNLSGFRDVTPPGDKIRFARNAGIEAMALFPAGSPHAGKALAVTEETLDDAGNHVAWFGDGNGRSMFSVARSGDYAITDATFLPDGRLLLLERRFGLQVSPAMRIRMFDPATIAEGALLEGETLLEADLGYRIDNMEGIDAWTDEQGRTRLTLVSDDNFNFFQSTILLEFVLAD